MAKGVQASPREKLHTFFREIVMGEPGIDRALADRVAERCVKHIDLLLEWDRNRGTGPIISPTFAQQVMRQPPGSGSSSLTHLAPTHVGPLRGPNLAPPPAPPVGPATAARVFDPYAFSVVVTLVKKGREALLARLSEIESADHLRQLANAQHLGVDQKLAVAEDLRLAILEGAERRIAGRRAAAS